MHVQVLTQPSDVVISLALLRFFSIFVIVFFIINCAIQLRFVNCGI